MSIIKVNPFDFGTVTLQTSPVRSYSSSSAGITGSIKVFARRSAFEKETATLGTLNNQQFDDFNMEEILSFLVEARNTRPNDTNISDLAGAYVDFVNTVPETPRNSIDVDVLRFEPSVKYTADTSRKLSIINSIMPQKRIAFPAAQFSFTNYHCLNFFTSSMVPPTAALLYPSSASLDDPNIDTSKVTGSYGVDGAFTFEFFIKPKNYLKDLTEFRAGTIFHLSSSYAISVVTGSSRDQNGIADKFRLVLQLSHSADYAPSSLAISSDSSRANAGVFPRDLILVSDDNTLSKDVWHHVAMRWGNNRDGNDAKIFIDQKLAGAFNLPSASIKPAALTNAGPANPDALVIGNYYLGSNSGDNRLSKFFAVRPSLRDGLKRMDPNSDVDGPTVFDLSHALNAEVHELRIFDTYRSVDDINKGRKQGLDLSTPGLKFYLPPFFTRESPVRQQIGEVGGILQTPFFGISGSTIDPFNISLSFGVGGHYINLENFTRDLATKTFPRLLHLTGAQINVTTQAKSANDFLYASGAVRYRNLFTPPCDNGQFMPNFFAISQQETGSLPTGKISSGSTYYKYRNDLNDLDLSLINLRNLLPSSSFVNYIVDEIPVGEDGEDAQAVVHAGAGFEEEILGASPEKMGIDPGEVLTIFQRTRDDTSNEVCFFDISTLFYGQRIKPGSLEIIDDNLSGSFGVLSMKLKDDGYGNIYRADAHSPHAKWNSVGAVFYDEGIVMIKSPMLALFGKDHFKINFRGEQDVHVLNTDIVAGAGLVTSSSNPNYLVVSASADANDKDSQFVAISGINFHDDNLNVIMRSKFAQPVIKRSGDKILFRTKLDF